MREIIQPTSSIDLAPTEKTNLVDFKTGDVSDDVTVPGWTTVELRSKNEQLRMELAEQEVLLLNKPI